MTTKKIAIISFFHTEASICLAKHIARLGYETDFYFIADIIRDKGVTQGIEYVNAPKYPGIRKLSGDEIPEIKNYTKDLPINIYILRLLSFSTRLWHVNKFILKRALKLISNNNYDAINIIGQHPWVEYIHNRLLGRNIIHTFHEIGSHQNEIPSTPLIDKVIQDRSKVIFLSKSTRSRFLQIEGAESCRTCLTEMGKFETNLLYERDIDLKIPLNLDKPTFLFYGYIKPYKGLDLLMEAHKLLANRYMDFNLIVAGGGNSEYLDYFLKQYNCFVINKHLSHDEIAKLNRIAYAIVLPYKSASQTGIVPNTFMFGKPVIATKVGALAEVIVDDKNGILVEPNNPALFAKAFERIIDNPKLYESLCMGTLRFGDNDEFDWNNIAKTTIDFLLS